MGTRDMEARQLRLTLAMDAIEDLFADTEPRSSIENERIGALIGLVFDAVRQTMPESPAARLKLHIVDD